MDNKKVTAQCEFEIVSAADLIDGLGTLTGRSGQGVIIPPPGDGPDNPLAWAIQDVSMASHARDEQEQARLCTNAVVGSRRALGCLVEWYVERDLGKWCKYPPGSPKQQAEFLMRRGIIDELTSRVLERAVDKRNRVEHDYVTPDLATAEDVVELLRRTMTIIRNQSNPSLAPWVFGIFLGGYGHGDHGRYATFGGWCEPLAVFSRFPPRPWVGLVLPDGEARALVRHAYLDNTTVEELVQLLALAEQKYGHTSSFMDLKSRELMGSELGLMIDK
jgi:hypothetical protein